MNTGQSIKLARVAGIRVGATYSWFFALFLIVWAMSSLFQDSGTSNTEAYLYGVAAAALFFVSLLLHEFGHALEARRHGIGVIGIDLWFLGGVAKLDRDSRSPGEEFKIAAAGPAVTVVIVVIAAGAAALAGTSDIVQNIIDREVSGASSATVLLGWLAGINALLLVFNLLPAFPLDGGRIARAIAWKVTGDRNRATRLSARLGEYFGYAMMAVGVVIALRGQPIDGVWLAILGLFLAQAARGAVASTAISEKLGGVTAADVMDAGPVTVPDETSVRDADDQFFHRYRSTWFPVVDDGGRYVGVLTSTGVDTAIRAGHPLLPVREVLDVAGGRASCVSSEEPLEELLSSEALRRLGALVVLDTDGIVRGLVTTDHVRRALGAALGEPTGSA
jgi:Zn-dependent protease